jgi:hypothetical protein
MEYILMLQRAWQILTRHKILWLFGLIAVLAGQDALFNLHGGRPVQPVLEAIVNLPPTAASLARSIVPLGSEIALIGLMIGLGVALTLIGMLANAALISLTQAAERGDAINFKVGLRAGWQHIDRLIIIRLIFNIPFVVLALLGFIVLQRLIDPTLAPLSFSQSLWVLQEAGLLPIFLIVSLIAGVFVGAIGIGSDRAVVIDGLGIVAALRQGWQTLRDHFSKYFVISGIFISTMLLIALVLFCPVALLFAERVAALAQTSSLNTDLTTTLWNEPSGSALIIIGVLLYAVITAFISITWTIAYRRYAR